MDTNGRMKGHTELTTCPICEESNTEKWQEKNGYQVVKCLSCSFIYTKNLPSDQFLRDYYSSEYQRSDGSFNPAGGVGRKIKYHLFRCWIKRFFKERPIETLEIGCGQGDFLSAVQEDENFKACGIDYAEAPVEYAKSNGLIVEQGGICEQKFEAGQFDLVVALHVIEHVRNLNETIREIARILREGGRIYVACPCVSHIKARLAGGNWKYLWPPGHLWYFSPKTLSLLMEKHGFAVETVSNFSHRAHVRILAKKPKS